MNPNQIYCRDCDFFVIGANQAQSGPVCMHAPPTPMFMQIKTAAGTGEQVIGIRTPILEPEREFCAHAYSYIKSRLAKIPAANPPTIKVDPPKDQTPPNIQEIMSKAAKGDSSNEP